MHISARLRRCNIDLASDSSSFKQKEGGSGMHVGENNMGKLGSIAWLSQRSAYIYSSAIHV